MNHASTPDLNRRSFKRVGIIAVCLLLLATMCSLFMARSAQASACAPPATDFGTVTSTIQISTATKYRVWSRIMAPDANANSYLLEIDGSTCYTVGDSGTSANTWTWVDHQNGNPGSKVEQDLTSGSHTIKLIGREPGVKLDRVLFVSDLACVPAGSGDNCATNGDIEAPAVNITAPADSAKVSGTVNITANASDNTAVTKTEFFVNGALVNTDTSAPYTYSWATTTVANGSASLMAKAYDATGNSSSDTVQVTVENGDSQAPTKPSNVSAQANAYNKVTVKWSASTDNVGVGGYWVSRDGVVLAKVTGATQYIDNSVLPNTDYSYRVSAFDNVGNTSALSDEAKVKTPNTPDTQAPSAPGNASAQVASSTQINLKWSASTDNIGVAAYEVYRQTGNGSPAKVATVTSLSYGDTGLTPSTSYSYYIIAKDAAGNMSQKSNIVQATTQAKPQPPANNKTGTLTGKVKLDKRRPGTATVTLTTWGSKRIVSTDSQGRYTFHNVPTGVYVVSYRAPGYYSKNAVVHIKANKTHTKNMNLQRR